VGPGVGELAGGEPGGGVRLGRTRERRVTMWSASYAEHIRRAEERLSSLERKTVDSAWGTIEYAERGSGIPLLVSHGIGGGFDACVVTAEVWAGEGLHVIGPSRVRLLRVELTHRGQPRPAGRCVRRTP
jgi:hypothetical protein